MRLYKYTALFVPDEDEKGVYNVTFPSLPEIATFGESRQEARFMAQDALELIILSKLEHGEELPSDKLPKKLSKGAFTEGILSNRKFRCKVHAINPRCQNCRRLKLEKFYL